MWSWGTGWQSEADDCRLRGSECGPEQGDRGSECGLGNALIAGPAGFDFRPLQLRKFLLTVWWELA
jgi:hypothetical protein